MTIFEKSKYYSEEYDAEACLGLPRIVVRALHARGVDTPEDIERFLKPSAADFFDPFLLPDMDKALRRIQLALEKGEKICIFGDYDVDGICATAMLVEFFRSVNASVSYHIPSRQAEGYGMSGLSIEKLHEQGIDLIITVDNGISAVEEIRRCAELGIDVIVTDHHIPCAALPECSAVVCHTIFGSHYPSKTLCGAGIAFKLLHALAGLDRAMDFIALAGLATVADVVPLTGENRILVKLGLDALNNGRCPIGLTHMLDSIAHIKKPYDSYNLGFAVAPRLNASGRMSNASLAVDLFLETRPERIDGIISELNLLNEKRQQEEAGILDSAMDQLSRRNLSDIRAIVLKSDSWNQGVIGIAASRISEMFHRPAILFSESDGMLKGSARSIDGVNIHSALVGLSSYFERFGGHAKAAGITMKAENFSAFADGLENALKAEYDNSVFIPRKRYEFDIDLSDISYELIEDIKLLAPFGEGNPSLVFRARHVFLSHIRRFGNNAQHIRMNVRSAASAQFEAVWFGSGSEFDMLLSAANADILFTIDVNRRCTTPCIQLKIMAVNAELPADKHAYIEDIMPRFCSSFIENHCYRDDGDSVRPMLKTDIELGKLCAESLSGQLVLVFSPNSAERILREIEDKNIKNLSVCYTRLPASPVCPSTVLIAPMLYTLPRSGYSRVIFYDAPPAAGVYNAVAAMLPNAELLTSSDPCGDFTSVAKKFDCRRDSLGGCYTLIKSKLKSRPYSYNELVTACSNELKLPNYLLEFAIEVFFELDFIRSDEYCAITLNPDARTRSLCESPIYMRIFNLQRHRGA